VSDTGKIDELVQRANQPFECDLVVGFYDLTGYTQWAAQHPPLQVLTRLDLHFEKTAGYIKKSGGHFIKAIGDAGLFIYPGDSSTEIDHAVDAMQTLQAQTNEWLRSKSMATQLLVKMNWGRWPAARSVHPATSASIFMAAPSTTPPCWPPARLPSPPSSMQNCLPLCRACSPKKSGVSGIYLLNPVLEYSQ